MLPDQVSNPGPLTYESGALPIAPRGPANRRIIHLWHKDDELSSCCPKQYASRSNTIHSHCLVF